MPLDLGEFAQFAMEQQTSKDEARDAVLSQLSRAVLGNYTAFIDGMRQIHEVDMDVSRAMVHVSNALRQLRGGKAALATHSLRITAQQRHLVRAKGVLTRLRWMRSVLQAGSHMKAAVAQGHFQEAVRVAATAAAHLEEATASKFVALEHARSQAAAALPGVRDAMDAALGTLVQQWVMLDPTPATTQVLPRVAHWLDSLAAGATGSSLLLGQREASPASAAASNSGGSEGAEASAAPGGFWESLPPLLRLPESFPSLLNAYMQLDEAGVDVRVPAVHSAAPAGGLALGGGEGDAGGDEADALLGEVTPGSHLEVLPLRLHACLRLALRKAAKGVLVDLLLRSCGARRLAVAAMRARASLAGDTSEASAALRRAIEDALSAYSAEHGRLWGCRMRDVAREVGEALAEKSRESAASGQATSAQSWAPPASHTGQGLWAAQLQVLASAAAAAGQEPPTQDGDVPCPPGAWEFEGKGAVAGGYMLTYAMGRLAAAVSSTLHCHLLLLALLGGHGDPRLDSWEFLHRDLRAPDQVQSPASEAQGRIRALVPAVAASAPTLWASAQHALGGALVAMVAGSGDALPPSALTQCLAVGLDVQRMGVEYLQAAERAGGGEGGSDTPPLHSTVSPQQLVQHCAPLRAALRLACSTLLDATHAATLQKLRGLLGKELWTPQPLPVTSVAALLQRVTHSRPLWWAWRPAWTAQLPFLPSAADGVPPWLATASSPGRRGTAAPGSGRAWRGLTRTPPWLGSPLEAIDTAALVTAPAAASSAQERTLGWGYTARLWLGNATGSRSTPPAAPWVKALVHANGLLAAKDVPARLHHPIIAASVAAVADVGDGVLLGKEAEDRVTAALCLVTKPGATPPEEASDLLCLARAEVLGYRAGWQGSHTWASTYRAAGEPTAPQRGVPTPALVGGNPFGRVCDGALPTPEQVQRHVSALQRIAASSAKLSRVADSVTLAPEGEATPASALDALVLHVVPALCWARDDVYVHGTPLLPVPTTSAPEEGEEEQEGDAEATALLDGDEEASDGEGSVADGGGEAGAAAGMDLSSTGTVVQQAIGELVAGVLPEGGLTLGVEYLLPGVVLTSAGLKGLLHGVSRYVRLLQCCPAQAVEVWEGLAGLVDLYMHAAASVALPLPAQQAVVGGQGRRMAAVAAGVTSPTPKALTAADIPPAALEDDGQKGFPYLDSNSVPMVVVTGTAALGALHLAAAGTGHASMATLATHAASILHAAKRDPWNLPFLTLRSFLLHAGARLSALPFFESARGSGSGSGGGDTGTVGSGTSRTSGRTSASGRGGPRTPQAARGKARAGELATPFHSPSVVRQGRGGGQAGAWLHFHQTDAAAPAALMHFNEAADLGPEMDSETWGVSPLPPAPGPEGLPPLECTGVAPRTVAAQSTLLLPLLLAAVRPWLQGVLPPAGLGTLRSWYATLATTVVQLRAVASNALVPRLVPEVGTLPQALAAQDWAGMRDISSSGASDYVQRVQGVLGRAGRVLGTLRNRGALPPLGHLDLWTAVGGRLFTAAAQGVAGVPRASLEGRGVMAMDMNALAVATAKHGPTLPALVAVAPAPSTHSGVAAVAGHGRPLPDKAWVDAFIKAFYFEDLSTDALAWLEASACVSGAEQREASIVPLAAWGQLLPHVLAPGGTLPSGGDPLLASAQAVGKPPALSLTSSHSSGARGTGAGVFRAHYPRSVGGGLLLHGPGAAERGSMLGRGNSARAKAVKAHMATLLHWHAAAAALDLNVLLSLEQEASGAFLGVEGGGGAL